MLLPQRRPDHTVGRFLKRTVAAQLHLLGCLLAIVGLFVVLRFARTHSDPSHFWACLAFGLTSILVFAASTVCHFMTDGFQITEEDERKLENIDQIAIFLFIAGTYSPVILHVISPPWDRILLIAVWLIGLAGVAYVLGREKLPLWARHRYINTSLFVLMGWVLVVRYSEAFEHLTRTEFQLLLAGGLSYSFGAVIYALQRPNPFKGVFGYHEIWHVMVLLGFAFHFCMILQFYR